MNVGELWASIGLDVAPLKRGAQESQQVLTGMTAQISRGMVGLQKSIYLVRGALATVGVGFSVSIIVSEINKGIEAIDKLRLTTIQIASQITTMQGPKNLEANYKEAVRYAENLAQKMEEVDANSMANAETLSAMNQTMALQGVFLDTNNKKQVEAFTSLSNALAMYTQGQNQSIQVYQEINALMSGNVNLNSRLATQLNGLIKQQGEYKDGLKGLVEAGREHGDTLERLSPYLIGITRGTKDLANTWMTVKSSAETALSVLRREVFKDFYAGAVENGKKFVEWLKTNSHVIAEKIKLISDLMIAGTKVAILYYSVMGGAALATKIPILLTKLAGLWTLLTTVITVNAVPKIITKLDMFGSVVTTTAGASTIAIKTLTGAFTVLSGVIISFYAGYQFGKVLVENFEMVRKAGFALAESLEQIWATLKGLWNAADKVIEGWVMGGVKGAIAGGKQAWKDYLDDLGDIKSTYAEFAYDTYGSKNIVQPKAPPVKVPKVPKPIKTLSKEELAKLKQQKDEYERILQDLYNTEAGLSKNTLDMIRYESEERIKEWKKQAESNVYIKKNLNKLIEQETKNTALALKKQMDENAVTLEQYHNDELKAGLEYSKERIKVIQLESSMRIASFLREAEQRGYTEQQITQFLIDEIERRKRETEIERQDQIIKDKEVAQARIEARIQEINLAKELGQINKTQAVEQLTQQYKDLERILTEALARTDQFKNEANYKALRDQLVEVRQELQRLALLSAELGNNMWEGMSRGVEDYLDTLTGHYGNMRTLTSQTLNEMQGMFTNLFDNILTQKVTDWADFFKQVCDRILGYIAELMAKMTMASIMGKSGGWGDFFSGVSSALGLLGGGGGGSWTDSAMSSGKYSLLGNLGSLLGSAKGNPFLNGDIVPFAKGGIIDRPTIYPMRSGKVALGGELADEAIMPLKRTPSGMLGVSAVGGGGGAPITSNVEVHIHEDGSVKRTQNTEGISPSVAQQLGRMIDNKVLEVIIQQKRAGGLLAG